RVQVGRLLLLPVSAAGAMALTVYSLHIVYIRILGSQAVWNPVSNLPLIWLVLGTLAAATVWQLLRGQGPFERALHALIRTAPDPAPWPHPEVSQRRRCPLRHAPPSYSTAPPGATSRAGTPPAPMP